MPTTTPPAIGWLESTGEPPVGKGGNRLPVSTRGLKAPSGPGHFFGRVGRVNIGAARCNGVIFLFPIGLIQFNFKSNSNF
jgi:hypothetical protein